MTTTIQSTKCFPRRGDLVPIVAQNLHRIDAEFILIIEKNSDIFEA